MKQAVKTITVAFIIAGIGLMGCTKHPKTEVTTPTAKPPVEAPKAVEKPVPPPPAAAPSDTFTPINMDSAAKAALQTLYFDFDKYSLRPDAITALGAAAKFLKDNPTVRVLIEGNCDERGSEEYNMALGEKRAKAAKEYLVSYGISADRIETTSYGKERLAKTDCGSDDSCNQLNRRDEWKLLSK